ncbi:MAG TPA: hypothetical protein PKU97_09675, partial [Kofleriaceae bacterium]|nr:hypothetical protein [Kofleriaceae bacterium]
MNREGKQQRSAVSRRRAATHLQELAWLEGYPAGERWWTRAGAPVLVDGALVARSRRIAQTLRREHGEALSELTGDAERWWGVVDAALRWCSARLAAPRPSGG